MTRPSILSSARDEWRKHGLQLLYVVHAAALLRANYFTGKQPVGVFLLSTSMTVSEVVVVLNTLLTGGCTADDDISHTTNNRQHDDVTPCETRAILNFRQTDLQQPKTGSELSF